MSHQSHELTFGPPVCYRPVCYLTPWGFIGGPWRYQRTETAEEAAEGPIIVTVEKVKDSAA